MLKTKSSNNPKNPVETKRNRPNTRPSTPTLRLSSTMARHKQTNSH